MKKKKICAICGKKFEPNANSQITCSEQCARERKRITNLRASIKSKKVKETRYCKVCGKIIPEGSRLRTACSWEHHDIYAKERAKKQRERRKEYLKQYHIERQEKLNEKKAAGKQKQKKPVNELARINSLAKEMGLNYGEYVARYGA